MGNGKAHTVATDTVDMISEVPALNEKSDKWGDKARL